MESGLSSKQKVFLGAAAVGAIVAGSVWLLSKKKPEKKSEKKKVKASSKEEIPVKQKGLEDEGDEVDPKKASKLKEEGNNAFSNKRYDEAISLYTEALKFSSPGEAHLIYSNRAAAKQAKGLYEEALDDSTKCIELKPEWSKGYFRRGKALAGMRKWEEAFVDFFKGSIFEPSNEEIKKMLKQASGEIYPLGDLDAKFIVEKKLSSLYFQQFGAESCKEIFEMNYEEFVQILDNLLASSENKNQDLITSSPLKSLFEKNAIAFYRLLVPLLLERNINGLSVTYARKAYELAPDDFSILLLIIFALIYGQADLKSKELWKHVTTAMEKDPSNPLAAHIYCNLLYNLLEEVDVQSTLKRFREMFNIPHMNKILIADAGFSLWSKLFDTREFQEASQKEAMKMQSSYSPNNPPSEEVLLRFFVDSLISGAFSKIYFHPFFLEALSQVVLTNPTLEKTLSSFRAAFITLDLTDELEILEPLIASFGVQCFKSGFIWGYEDTKEEEKLEALRTSLSTTINEGGLPSLSSLALFSMYAPLYELPNAKSLLETLMPKARETLKQLFQLNLDRIEERELTPSLKSLTAVPESDERSPYWDEGRQPLILLPVEPLKELQWLFPSYSFVASAPMTRILIAGCGAGEEVFRVLKQYEGIHVTAVDSNPQNLAFAVRKLKALGVTNVTFALADIHQLDSSLPDFGPFDMIFASNVLDSVPEPMEVWKKLMSLLVPGGIIRATVTAPNRYDLFTSVRDALRQQGFDLENLSDSELRNARKLLVDQLLQSQSPELQEMGVLPSFYVKDDLRDLLGNPHYTCYSFSDVEKFASEPNVNFVGFEFQGIGQEWILRYRVLNPRDPQMADFHSVNKFDEAFPESFHHIKLFFGISFICEKKK